MNLGEAYLMSMNPLLTTGVNSIWTAYQSQMEAVEARLGLILKDVIPLANEMTTYIVSGGGKGFVPFS